MKEIIKYAAALLPAVCMAVFCGCSDQTSNTAEEAVTTFSSLATTITTTTESTTTTTTTNVYTPPDDPELVERMQQMTLAEKAAQMMLVCCSDPEAAQQAAENGAGGLCLFAPPFAYKSAEQVQEMTGGFQSAAKIPLLISVDEEGGTVNRISLNPQLRAYQFWSPHYLYAEGGWDLICSDTEEKADLLRSLGVNVNLAPVCDVPQSEADYIYPRCFSMQPADTADYITTVVRIMKEKKLGCTLKHFPGYGGSTDTHQNMAYDSRPYDAFTSGDFLPFAAGIAAGADSVMVSHNIVECMDPDHPASLSQEVHRILREELGFRGVIISDDLNMNAITEFTAGQSPAVAAVLAGNDLLCYADFEDAVSSVIQAVQLGEIPEEQLNDSVLRILYWKQSLGLFEQFPAYTTETTAVPSETFPSETVTSAVMTAASESAFTSETLPVTEPPVVTGEPGGTVTIWYDFPE
ncbi:MAG TPA: beta-hexosaminidase [Ruminococcus sp.]|nr:beta-hexosaminidase [Ruminococcus sp.]